MSHAQAGEQNLDRRGGRSLRARLEARRATGPASRTSWPARAGRPARHPAPGAPARRVRAPRGCGRDAHARGIPPAVSRRPRRRRRRLRHRPVDARSAPGKPAVSAARSLLFGLLALQNNFIDRDALLAAFNAWVADKSQSLGQILLDRGALSPARHAAARRPWSRSTSSSTASTPSAAWPCSAVVPAVRDDLEGLPDLDLQASLLYLRLATGVAGEDTDSESTASWDEDSAATDTEGRFRIVRFHDRGALGEVYVARDQQLHRIVALKRIRAAMPCDRDKCARFVVEAEITGRLEHPGHRAGLRPGDLRRRPPVLRHAVHPRRQPQVGHRAVSPGRGERPRPRRADPGAAEAVAAVPRRLQRDRLCPQPGRAASRPEAGQHHAGQVRRDAGGGLGPGQERGPAGVRHRRRRRWTIAPSSPSRGATCGGPSWVRGWGRRPT